MEEPGYTHRVDSKNVAPVRRAQEDGETSGEYFTAPLGSSKSGHLRFTNGVQRLLIRADSQLRGLYHARFGNLTPTIWVRGGTVKIRYPACDWSGCPQGRPAEVALNARIPWDVEVRGSASRLVADLRETHLMSLSLAGGVGRLEVALPIPVRTVAVVILGGANNVVVRRPWGIATRLRVSGGATNLRFDRRRIGASGSDVDLRDRGYDAAADRYDVVVTGGANNMVLEGPRE